MSVTNICTPNFDFKSYRYAMQNMSICDMEDLFLGGILSDCVLCTGKLYGHLSDAYHNIFLIEIMCNTSVDALLEKEKNKELHNYVIALNNSNNKIYFISYFALSNTITWNYTCKEIDFSISAIYPIRMKIQTHYPTENWTYILNKCLS